jgi:hypothetical protein
VAPADDLAFADNDAAKWAATATAHPDFREVQGLAHEFFLAHGPNL